MNRKQKIIISVTGIFLVLLLLVGLTYAYFLTKVTGNTNDKSISVTTANLELVYGDDDGSIIGDGELIEPGKTFEPKTFTVTNTGNSAINYAVILENLKIVYAQNSGEQVKGAATSLAYPDNFKLKLDCSSNLSDKKCNTMNGTLPTTNDILVFNIINAGETQSYTLTLEYDETGTDQSADMNKTIEGKINILDINNTVDLAGIVTNYEEGDYVQTNSVQRISQIDSNGNFKMLGLEAGTHKVTVFNAKGEEKASQQIEILKGEAEEVKGYSITITNSSRILRMTIDASNKTFTIANKIEQSVVIPYPNGTLAYNILYNAMTSNIETSTLYSPEPLTKPAVEVNGENERTLSLTEDDFGTSYYFRGNIIDNYVNFAGMCWKIVRIDGNGNTKLILEDQYAECNDTAENDKNSDGIVYTGNWSVGNGKYGYKIITAEKTSDTGDVISKNVMIPDFTNDTNGTQSKKLKIFQESKLSNYYEKLSSGNWCINDDIYISNLTNEQYEKVDNTIDDDGDGVSNMLEEIYVNNKNFIYDAGYRLRTMEEKNPTLKCNGKTLEYIDASNNALMYVGELTADEMVFSGGVLHQTSSYNYLKSNNIYGTLTPAAFIVKTNDNGEEENGYNTVYDMTTTGGITRNSVGYNEVHVRPVISLKLNNTVKSGTGLINDPYVIS